MYTTGTDTTSLQKNITREESELYDDLGIAYWEENASCLKKELDSLKYKNIADLKRRLDSNPEYVRELVRKIIVTSVSSEIRKLYKISDNRILEKGLLQFFKQETYTHFINTVLAFLIGNREYSYISEKQTSKGDSIVVKVKIKLAKGSEESWNRWLVTESDVTGLVNENIIRVELLNKQLKEKDRLISIIAHDLKNPFNNILGFSNLLSNKFDELGSERVKTFLEYINDSATQSFNLLSNLLNWAKSKNTKQDFFPERLELHELIRETVLLLAGSCRKKNIEIEVNCDKKLEVYYDINVVQFILRNLLTNAIKFSYRNSVIDVLCKDEEKDSSVKVCIKDHGMGMSEDERSTLFYSEKSHSRKGTENEHGTGLGLVMCKEFLDKTGGTIKVNSKQGEGSEFVFNLPKA